MNAFDLSGFYSGINGKHNPARYGTPTNLFGTIDWCHLELENAGNVLKGTRRAANIFECGTGIYGGKPPIS